MVPKAGAKAITGATFAGKGEAGEPAPGSAAAQRQFGGVLAALTGLSPSVIGKWLAAEQPVGSPATPGSNNWLNIETGYGAGSGVGSASDQYVGSKSASQAAVATYQWLTKYQPGILATAGKGESAQIAAIENSGFAESHYGGHLAATRAIALNPHEASERATHTIKGENTEEEAGILGILQGKVPGFSKEGALERAGEKALETFEPPGFSWKQLSQFAVKVVLLIAGAFLVVYGIMVAVKPGGTGLASVRPPLPAF